MKKSKQRNQIIKELLDITDREFTDEELIHRLIMTEMTENSDSEEKVSFGQKASDAVAKFAGSWAFIFSFIAVMVIWMVLNIVLAQRAFDAYPFILLNLVAFLHCRRSGTSHNDEPKQAGGKGQKARRKRLSHKSQKASL